MLFFLSSASLASSLFFSFEQEVPIKFLTFSELKVPEQENYSIFLQQVSDPMMPVLMLASKGNSSSCEIKNSIWTCDSLYQDVLSYSLNLGLHYLSLPRGSDWSLKILAASISSPIRWNLTIASQSCVEGCKGKCISGRCACSSSFLGHDCKIPTFYLTNGTSSNFNLEPSTYHFFRLSKYVNKCVVTKGKERVNLYTVNENVNKEQSNLPTEIFYDGFQEIANETLKFEIEIKKIKVLGFWPYSKVTLDFNCSESEGKKLKTNALIVMWVLVSFTIFVVVVWIVVILLRIFKIRFFRFGKTHPKKRFFNDNELKVIHKSLDKEDLCVICLEGYHQGNKIRELECSHKYHQHCIENWLQTHDYCCVCKQNYKETQAK
jgi:hypothetical protein